MTGNEMFTFNEETAGFTLADFWQFEYSNVYNLQEVIAEFIVAKALGMNEAHNVDYWTLYDIKYRNQRIEVKQSSYYHPWNENGNISEHRTFGITKANSNYENSDTENNFERQNDIYVFCLNTGRTKETAYPLNLNNWEFYIVPTDFINANCENNKTISLGRIRNFGFKALNFDEIKSEIDSIIDRKEFENELK